MIYFSSLPEPLSSIGGALPVTLAGLTDPTADLRLYADDGTLLGMKRVVAQQDEATIDIAPLLRRVVRYAPMRGATELFTDTDRLVRVRFEAECEGVIVTAAAHAYFASDEAVSAPLCCTTQPRERLLATDEWDELTFLTDGPLTITLTAEGRQGVTSEQFKSYLGGAVLLRIAAADFPDAHAITVDAGDYGVFRYTLIAPIEGSVRLAWRNRLGGIEHYTFPIVTRKEWVVHKERAYGAEGYCLAAIEREEQWSLRSAYEVAARCEALTELLSAEEVWRVTEEGYEAVDVLSDAASVEQNGSLQLLTVTMRAAQKGGRL